MENLALLSSGEAQPLLTTQQAEQLTGFSRSWLYRLKEKNLVTTIKLADRLLFFEADLKDYLHTRRNPGRPKST